MELHFLRVATARAGDVVEVLREGAAELRRAALKSCSEDDWGGFQGLSTVVLPHPLVQGALLLRFQVACSLWVGLLIKRCVPLELCKGSVLVL